MKIANGSAISIHATHAGGDFKEVEPVQTSKDFNPRHPCGWRRLPKKRTGSRHISIHATHAGGDLMFDSVHIQGMISIHATHAGGDCPAWTVSVCRWQFQSTPPMRVATKFGGFD